ncbi:MAG: hypothetical protein MRERV_44c005 [Mycoplasmataceae bacterium RV_VA103A]|nr:MAG: hypothetical protein MRERV_44c005 [Mycoplasmataceae bacterium RV_VA103A]
MVEEFEIFKAKTRLYLNKIYPLVLKNMYKIII